jgi:dihydrofolate reductase
MPRRGVPSSWTWDGIGSLHADDTPRGHALVGGSSWPAWPRRWHRRRTPALACLAFRFEPVVHVRMAGEAGARSRADRRRQRSGADQAQIRKREDSMSRLVVTEYLSLDGVMEDPGGAEQFEHGGWTVPYWSDELGEYQFAGLRASDALLLGRVTYQEFAAAWPNMEHEAGPFAERMNSLPKFVATTTVDQLEWNATPLKGDVAAEVARLKQQPGQDLLVYGSGALVRTLMQHNLVDEFRLIIYPVVLGNGKRLFEGASTASLKPLGVKTFSSGVVALSYQPAERAV